MYTARSVSSLLNSRMWAFAAYAVVIGLFAIVLVRNRAAIAALGLNDVWIFIVMLAITLPAVTLRGVINAIAFRPPGRAISLSQGAELAVLQTMGNYLPLSAGLLAKGVALNRSFGVRYDAYIAIALYTMALSVSVSAAAALLSLLLIGSQNIALFVSFAVAGCAVVIIAIPVRAFPIFSRWQGAMRSDDARRHFIAVLAPLTGLHVLIVLVGAWRIQFAFSIIGIDISYVHVLLFVSGGILARLVAITPGAIGIREGIVAGLAAATGIDFEMAVLAVGVDRLAEVIVIFTAGFIILRRKQRALQPQEAQTSMHADGREWKGDQDMRDSPML